jgi:hypothetical protein
MKNADTGTKRRGKISPRLGGFPQATAAEKARARVFCAMQTTPERSPILRRCCFDTVAPIASKAN